MRSWIRRASAVPSSSASTSSTESPSTATRSTSQSRRRSAIAAQQRRSDRVGVAVGAEHEQPFAGGAARDPGEQRERVPVGQVEVVEREHERACAAAAVRLRLDLVPLGRLAADRLRERRVGTSACSSHAAVEDRRSRRARLGREARRESRLADPGLAREQDDLRRAAAGRHTAARRRRFAPARPRGRRTSPGRRGGGGTGKPRLGAAATPSPQRVGELLRLRATAPCAGGSPAGCAARVYSASAAPRSPAASSRRISARWISSESGSSAAWRRVSATARRRSPSRAAARGELLEQRDDTVAMLVLRLERPLVVEAGQERAIAQRERLLGRPSARRRSASSTSTQVSGASPTRSRVATSASSPSARRRAQSALRRLARALSSSTSGQKTDATAGRGCGPGTEREPRRAARAVARPGAIGARRRPPPAISPTSRSRSIVKAYTRRA